MAKNNAAHKKVGEWMKETRDALGLTQEEFALRIGKIKSFVAKTEIGEREMGLVEFVEICQALNANPAKMFDRVSARLR